MPILNGPNRVFGAHQECQQSSLSSGKARQTTNGAVHCGGVALDPGGETAAEDNGDDPVTDGCELMCAAPDVWG
jgi:hypothetical protein